MAVGEGGVADRVSYFSSSPKKNGGGGKVKITHSHAPIIWCWSSIGSDNKWGHNHTSQQWIHVSRKSDLRAGGRKRGRRSPPNRISIEFKWQQKTRAGFSRLLSFMNEWLCIIYKYIFLAHESPPCLVWYGTHFRVNKLTIKIMNVNETFLGKPVVGHSQGGLRHLIHLTVA